MPSMCRSGKGRASCSFSASTSFFLLLVLCLQPDRLVLVGGQGITYFNGVGINPTPITNGNMVYFCLVLFFALNFLTPVAAWFYRVVIERIIDTATEKLLEVQQRISERISDAGRKLSDRMRN